MSEIVILNEVDMSDKIEKYIPKEKDVEHDVFIADLEKKFPETEA